ncbi:RICIN domain-containing protein [Streptomyces sp. NBC_01477]|uniref:RICIN domain-containing protein n=1 Tax=Streptomyces sp. NBC_01477 TaxID=2976015 RepID=UPI002E2F5206|nr:RICIN domain-containing protein [Streptomyces sp. NBC_01477]
MPFEIRAAPRTARRTPQPVRHNAVGLSQSDSCLDATGHGNANGTLMEIWTCDGGANQKWSRS